MKPQLHGIIGMALGLAAFLSGLAGVSGRSDFALIWLATGIFLFGCGLGAAAIGARR